MHRLVTPATLVILLGLGGAAPIDTLQKPQRPEPPLLSERSTVPNIHRPYHPNHADPSLPKGGINGWFKKGKPLWEGSVVPNINRPYHPRHEDPFLPENAQTGWFHVDRPTDPSVNRIPGEPYVATDGGLSERSASLPSGLAYLKQIVNNSPKDTAADLLVFKNGPVTNATQEPQPYTAATSLETLKIVLADPPEKYAASEMEHKKRGPRIDLGKRKNQLGVPTTTVDITSDPSGSSFSSDPPNRSVPPTFDEATGATASAAPQSSDVSSGSGFQTGLGEPQRSDASSGVVVTATSEATQLSSSSSAGATTVEAGAKQTSVSSESASNIDTSIITVKQGTGTELSSVSVSSTQGGSDAQSSNESQSRFIVTQIFTSALSGSKSNLFAAKQTSKPSAADSVPAEPQASSESGLKADGDAAPTGTGVDNGSIASTDTSAATGPTASITGDSLSSKKPNGLTGNATEPSSSISPSVTRKPSNGRKRPSNTEKSGSRTSVSHTNARTLNRAQASRKSRTAPTSHPSQRASATKSTKHASATHRAKHPSMTKGRRPYKTPVPQPSSSSPSDDPLGYPQPLPSYPAPGPYCGEVDEEDLEQWKEFACEAGDWDSCGKPCWEEGIPSDDAFTDDDLSKMDREAEGRWA